MNIVTIGSTLPFSCPYKCLKTLKIEVGHDVLYDQSVLFKCHLIFLKNSKVILGGKTKKGLNLSQSSPNLFLCFIFLRMTLGNTNSFSPRAPSCLMLQGFFPMTLDKLFSKVQLPAQPQAGQVLHSSSSFSSQAAVICRIKIKLQKLLGFFFVSPCLPTRQEFQQHRRCFQKKKKSA